MPIPLTAVPKLENNIKGVLGKGNYQRMMHAKLEKIQASGSKNIRPVINTKCPNA